MVTLYLVLRGGTLMPIQFISAFGYMAAAVAVGGALYQWRRSSSLYTLLVESANRYEELRQRGAALEQSMLKVEAKGKQHAETSRRLTASLEESREKGADLVRRLEQKELEGKLVTDRLELQKSNLQKQQAIVLEAQRIAEAQSDALRLELTKERRLAQDERKAWAQEQELLTKDWQTRLTVTETLHQAAEQQAKSSDPAELHRLKRKIAQYARLYNSMKGLREMSEERNRNWEVALQRLATWILEEKGFSPLALAVGPLVGQAMQAIGAQLIDDHEIMAPRDGAELASHMDSEADADDAVLTKGFDVGR